MPMLRTWNRLFVASPEAHHGSWHVEIHIGKMQDSCAKPWWVVCCMAGLETWHIAKKMIKRRRSHGDTIEARFSDLANLSCTSVFSHPSSHIKMENFWILLFASWQYFWHRQIIYLFKYHLASRTLYSSNIMEWWLGTIWQFMNNISLKELRGGNFPCFCHISHQISCDKSGINMENFSCQELWIWFVKFEYMSCVCNLLFCVLWNLHVWLLEKPDLEVAMFIRGSANLCIVEASDQHGTFESCKACYTQWNIIYIFPNTCFVLHKSVFSCSSIPMPDHMFHHW